MTVTDWIVCYDACQKFNMIEEGKKVKSIIGYLVDANLESAKNIGSEKGKED